MSKQVAAGVFGASGYTGSELLRYLAAHPAMEVAWATAGRQAGRAAADLHPHLAPAYPDLVLQPPDPQAAPPLDVAFLALPHGEAAELGSSLRARGVRVVDLSADWRLRDPAAYERWYGRAHPEPGALGSWVYGLPELHREEVAGAGGVANPGCYPTAALLALVPPLRAGAIEPAGIVVSAASGASGAGRGAGPEYLLAELGATVRAYGVPGHRHTPEIEQELSAVAGEAVRVTFVPHLAPMSRGLLATCFAPLAGPPGAVREALEAAYKAEPFVHVLPPGAQPSTKQAWGTNHAFLGVEADERTGTAILTCAIDNLGKGAAGQAVQNANLMLGLEETAGLDGVGAYP